MKPAGIVREVEYFIFSGELEAHKQVQCGSSLRAMLRKLVSHQLCQLQVGTFDSLAVTDHVSDDLVLRWFRTFLETNEYHVPQSALPQSFSAFDFLDSSIEEEPVAQTNHDPFQRRRSSASLPHLLLDVGNPVDNTKGFDSKATALLEGGLIDCRLTVADHLSNLTDAG